MSEMIISKETMRRVLSDVKDIYKNPLNDNGIYYKHDEDNILKGYAMIVGPSDTPYQYGFYFFTINFPGNYPFQPPKVEFQQNPYNTRFHPNFYRNGKVCLSLLNTWRGEQWTSCQTLSSILLTICSVMTKDPLINEPGITVNHRDNIPFNKIITYQNFNFSIIDMILNNNISSRFKIFNEDIIECYKKNKLKIEELLNKLLEKYEEELLLRTGIYNMNIPVNYKNIKLKYDTIKKNIKV
uniref:Ubiquitin-conjugating enzyme E2 Z n=1 Tax=viral metagenome TaxID=1070528 RepID=A0A6C0AW41_9ZZZZ|tara:strand:- start:1375 stop:2094 length:720 start_codon:yes stop_codon:yes gene_type:complete